MVGSASDPLGERHGWLFDEIRSQWNWVASLGFLNKFEFSLTLRLAWNAVPLTGWSFKADMSNYAGCDSGLEETALHAFCYCERVRLFWSHVGEWTACIDPKQFVLLDVGYFVDNVDPPWKGEKRVVFLVVLAVARMVIWETRKKGL